MAEMAMREPTVEGLLHVGHLWGGVVPQQRVHGHDDSRRAEAALGAVSLGDPLLKHVCSEET